MFRLALVTNRYPRNADDLASPFVHHFCEALVQNGVKVAVLAPEYPGPGGEADPWVRRFHWTDSDRVFGELSLYRPGDLVRLGRGIVKGSNATRNFLEETKPDFALALWALPSGYWLWRHARSLGIPYAVWCLGSDIQVWGRRPGVRSLVSRILVEAAGVYADGFALAEETAELSGRACRFLPSLRPLRRAATATDPQEPVQPYMLYYGRMSHDKGTDTLLDAARLLPGAFPSRMVLCGPCAPGFDAAREIEARGVQARCTYLPPQPPALLAELVRGAHAVVIPSRRDSIPLVLGEAIQLGTPVICSDLPDLCAVLSRYQVGRVFAAGDATALARALTDFRPPAHFSTQAARFLADFSPGQAARTFIHDVLQQPLVRRRISAPAARERVHA